MADRKKIVKANVQGEIFVDTTCINCDACRRFAPKNFKDSGPYSYVSKQPENEEEKIACAMALLSCPTGSIGGSAKDSIGLAKKEFPMLIENQIYINGFNSKKSFGADSYFIKGKENWLVDSPRFTPSLINFYEKNGGIDYIFLSHRDDVADSEQYAKRFNAKRIIHEGDIDACSNAEIVISGLGPEDRGDFILYPSPGHTKGSMILLYREMYLFTGDHFAYRKKTRAFGSFDTACWYDWDIQKDSVKMMQDFEKVRWILPGHGSRGQVALGKFPEIVREALAKM